MRNLFLVLAILGAAIPLWFFVPFFAGGGTAGEFISDGFANGPASGLTADLLIASVVFWLLMAKRRSDGGAALWPFILLNLFIGLSCALPAYLWVEAGRKDSVLGEPS